MHSTAQQSSKREPAESAGDRLDVGSGGSAGQNPAESPPEAPGDAAIAHGEDGLEDVALWPYWV